MLGKDELLYINIFNVKAELDKKSNNIEYKIIDNYKLYNKQLFTCELFKIYGFEKIKNAKILICKELLQNLVANQDKLHKY